MSRPDPGHRLGWEETLDDVTQLVKGLVEENVRLRRENATLRKFVTRVTEAASTPSMADDAAALLARISEEGSGSTAGGEEVGAS